MVIAFFFIAVCSFHVSYGFFLSFFFSLKKTSIFLFEFQIFFSLTSRGLRKCFFFDFSPPFLPRPSCVFHVLAEWAPASGGVVPHHPPRLDDAHRGERGTGGPNLPRAMLLCCHHGRTSPPSCRRCSPVFDLQIQELRTFRSSLAYHDCLL